MGVFTQLNLRLYTNRTGELVDDAGRCRDYVGNKLLLT